MKKLLYLLLLPWIFSCSSTSHEFSSWAKEDERVKTLSTTAMIGDLVTSIGGEHIANLVLIRGELDPHSYELVKGDNEKLQIADLVFHNGLFLEHGASLHYYLAQDDDRIVGIGDLIKKKHPKRIIQLGLADDPHIWMDLSLWKEATYFIEEALSKKDPDHAKDYKKNGRLLRKKLDEMHSEIYSRMQRIDQEKRYLVTSHDAFSYFAKAYLASDEEREMDSWHKRFQAPEGLAPEGQITPLDIQKIIDHVKAHGIRTIFAESNVSLDSIKKILSCSKSEGLDVKIAKEPLFGDSMGPSNDSEKASYFSMMQYNAKTIEEYLQ